MNKKPLIRLTVSFFTLLILIFAKGIFTPIKSMSAQEQIFTVAKGQGAAAIGRNLTEARLVRGKLFFEIAVVLNRGARKLQAGRYLITNKMSCWQIAKKIIKGDVARQTIFIPEGWNTKEISRYLSNLGLAKTTDFNNVVNNDFSSQFAFLKDKPETASLEGYLFPDTYEIDIGSDTETIIRQMLVNFDRKLTPEIRQEIKNQKKTIFEIVTMASLLEKEAKTLEDKKLISGIFWKRLNTGMVLQSCATVVYALGRNPGQLSYEDLKIDSPYNTYKYSGLPPGPICNPGMDSIIAAIYPKTSQYWYFLSPPDGTIYYSQTLEEHNIKKAKYLQSY